MEELNNKQRRRIVIKVGTSSLIKADTGVIHLSQLAKICEQITELQKSNEFQCAIVTSGAVGAGMLQLGIKEKPKEFAKTTGVSGDWTGALDALLRRHVCDVGSENGASAVDVGKSHTEIAIQSGDEYVFFVV